MEPIRDLPLPSPSSEQIIDDSDIRDVSKQVDGWDENIGLSQSLQSKSSFFGDAHSVSNFRASIATHAVAHGCSVIGTKFHSTTNPYRLDDYGDASMKASDGRPGYETWTTSFEPYNVCRVTSNDDGSVVAASTGGGAISILKGVDGSVLATRRVSAEADDSNFSPAEVHFVAGAKENQSVVGDILVILSPCSQSQNKMGDGQDEFGNSTLNNQSPQFDAILVSGINGNQLNSSDSMEVAGAAKNMSIDVLNLNLPNSGGGESSQIVCLRGCFVDNQTVRFVVATANGNISVHDYDVESRTSLVIHEKINLCDDEGNLTQGWAFEPDPGIKVDVCNDRSGSGAFFLLTATSNHDIMKVCWYNAESMVLDCEYLIPPPSGRSKSFNDQPKILAIEPVVSCSPESAVSAVIAYKSSASTAGAVLKVVQAVLESNGNDPITPMECDVDDMDTEKSSFTLHQPHLLYTIPHEPSLTQFSVQSIDIAPTYKGDDYSYTFQYLVSYGSVPTSSTSRECKEFRCKDSNLVGKFRLYLARDKFDMADSLLASTDARSLTSNKYASAHGSEVALWRFRRLLSTGDISSDENMPAAKECLKRLRVGAATGGVIGVRSLLEAAVDVSTWPLKVPMERRLDGTLVGMTIMQFRMALSTILATFEEAIESAPSDQIQNLEDEKKNIDLRASAMKCLETILPSDEGVDIYLSPPFSEAVSPAHLFQILVAQGAFVVAERMRQSEWGKSLTPELAASSIMELQPTVDPRSYCSWLSEIIIPGLSVNHPLSAKLRSWACRTADVFDEDECQANSIDSSIFLLQTVQDSTAKQHGRIHASFAVSSPFIDEEFMPPSEVGSPSNELNLSGYSAVSSIASPTFVNVSPTNSGTLFPSVKYPNPTVLQVGLLRASKGSKSFRARRVLQTSSSDVLTTESSFLSSRQSTAESSGDCEEDFYDDECVESKLRDAIHLKKARALGLPHSVAKLGNFSDLGGASFIAKELIRSYSKSAVDDDDRAEKLTNLIKPLCESSSVSFDNAIAQYAKDLCDSNRSDPEVLHEAASLSRCCEKGFIKCQVALKVLRASLLCHTIPRSITSLSKDAMQWATDEAIRSELKEASRLLVIDSIVRRYCGSRARDLFRVSDPRHGVRLINHVCRHIDEPSALSDALNLCDAFTHVSRLEACLLILQRTALARQPQNETKEMVTRAEQCANIMRSLYSLEPSLAENVGMKAVTFCSETISECSNIHEASAVAFHPQQRKQDAMAASAAASSILSVMAELSSKTNATQSQTCAILLREFQRISELQKSFSIFLPLEALMAKRKHNDITKKLLQPCVDLLLSEKNQEDVNKISLRSLITKAKRGCFLLFGDDKVEASSLWYEAVGEAASFLAKEGNQFECYDLLEASGLLDVTRSGETPFLSIMSVAVSLCIRASKESRAFDSPTLYDDECDDGHMSQYSSKVLFAMKCIVRASSLLQEHALVYCPESILARTTVLSGLFETISHVLIRADGGFGERIDSFQLKLSNEARLRREPFRTQLKEPSKNLMSRLPASPTLHASWYVGDGLLLSPLETLTHCMAYCKELMNIQMCSQKKVKLSNHHEIFTFLENRGAYTISLRMQTCASTAILTRWEDRRWGDYDYWSGFCDLSQDSMVRLAERSLGGSGNGITSGNIDSQLAVAYLLSLPIKIAFKVYRASLPSAMSKRDFHRLTSLANIGLRAGGVEASSDAIQEQGRKPSLGWTKQRTFIYQCRRLSSNAKWWNILQKNNVIFDPRRFDPTGGKTAENVVEYCASLVPLLIKGAYLSQRPESVLALATKFVDSFGLDPYLAPQKMLEFLLSWPSDESVSCNDGKEKNGKSSGVDIRQDITACGNAAREMLLLLPSPMARSAVLRQCVISLESESHSSKDYEKHDLALSLYHNELSIVLAEKSGHLAFQAEFERIDRRKDALAILSSFFQGHKIDHRPNFSQFFEPLPVPFKSEIGKPARRLAGVLGKESDDDFDPLLPLMDFFAFDSSSSTASSLHPLCHSLGLPPGYVHARSLCARFQNSQKDLPSFEMEVRPVVNRLQAARDGAKLAEWCAMQYKSGEADRLQCLTLALNLAIKSSKEAEIVRANASKDDVRLAEYESAALETVKRISAAKSALFDRVKVEEIFEGAALQENSPVALIVSKLVERVQTECTDGANLSPEAFVEGLLTEGSTMTAISCLDNGGGFNLNHFRQVANLVHRACKALADMYSHVHVGKCARKLAKRWLVHGDDVVGRQDPTNALKKVANHPREKSPNRSLAVNRSSDQVMAMSESFCIDEDDTADFVMDLNAIATNQEVWSDDIVAGENILGTVKNITADEEPSALKCLGSAREVTEYNNARVAIRIAFVVSFADGYYQKKENSKPEDKENISNSNENSDSRSKMRSKKLRLSNIEGSRQGDFVTEHARELLEIVFAKSGGSNWVNSRSTLAGGYESTALSTKSPLGRSFSASVRTQNKVYKSCSSTDRKTITFAMRHRALRTASILCPQEVLDMIIKEEGYFNVTEDAASSCTLSLCAFGSFLAMEIEVMGLSLPHSDLVRLSTMHFPSYARALWRNHGRSDCRGFKGRLLLLLLDLCIKDGKVTDKALMNSIISEMAMHELPRTHLSACERIAAVEKLDALMSSGEDGAAILMIFKKTAHSIFSETKRNISTDADSKNCLIALRRLGKVVEKLGGSDNGQGQLSNFVDLLCKLADDCTPTQQEWVKGIFDVAIGVVSYIKDREIRSQIFRKLVDIEGGCNLLESKFAPAKSSQFCMETSGNKGGTSSEDMVKQVENSFASDVSLLLADVKASSV